MGLLHSFLHVWSFFVDFLEWLKFSVAELPGLLPFFSWTLVLSLVRLSAFCSSNIISLHSLSNLLSLTDLRSQPVSFLILPFAIQVAWLHSELRSAQPSQALYRKSFAVLQFHFPFWVIYCVGLFLQEL